MKLFLLGAGAALLLLFILSHHPDPEPDVRVGGKLCRYEHVSTDMSGPNYDYVCR